MDGFSVQPTGQQTMSQREVDAFLQDARSAPTTKSPRILGINMQAMMTAKRNGYPKHMYHATHEMRQALKEEEEIALAQIGYSTTYISRSYPKALFRRNMDQRFEPQFDPATQIQVNNAFIEEKLCRDETHEKELRLMKPKPGQSAWFERITEVPDLEDGPVEDPKVTIARLQGQVEGLQAEVSKGPGKKKAEQVAA